MVFFNFILNYKKHYENLLLFYDFLNVFQTEQRKLSEKIEKFSKIKEIDDNSDYDYLYDFSNTFKSIIEQMIMIIYMIFQIHLNQLLNKIEKVKY